MRNTPEQKRRAQIRHKLALARVSDYLPSNGVIVGVLDRMGPRRLAAFVAEFDSVLSNQWDACVARVVSGEDSASRILSYPAESNRDFARRTAQPMAEPREISKDEVEMARLAHVRRMDRHEAELLVAALLAALKKLDAEA